MGTIFYEFVVLNGITYKMVFPYKTWKSILENVMSLDIEKLYTATIFQTLFRAKIYNKSFSRYQ